MPSAYYLKNREKILARNEAWWKAHPEKLRKKWRRKSKSASGRAHAKRNREKYSEQIAAKKAAWQKNRKPHLRKYLRNYYLENAEKIRSRSRAWYRDNKGKALAGTQARRAKEKQSPLGDQRLIAEWMREMRNRPFCRCHWCGTKVMPDNIHFDHVHALSKGGSHSIGNLCVACSECNLTKHNRIISDWICGGQTFLSL